MTAEADMWAAAVEHAFRAGCASRIPGNKNDMGGASALEAANEWRFLTAPHGPWAESRNRICEMCGLEPDVVRQEALRRGPSRQALLGLRADARRAEKAAAPKPVKQPHVYVPPPEVVARKQAVVADWIAGVEVDEIARRHGITANYVTRIASDEGARRPEWFKKWVSGKASRRRREQSATRDAEILRRYHAGETYAAIGKDLGLPWTTVRSAVMAASNASGGALGGACVAGGGGGPSVPPFHAHSMPIGQGG